MKTLAIGAVAAAAIGSSATAQSSDWEFQATLYGWLPGMDVTSDTDFGRVTPSLSSSDVLDNLDFAFMGVFEARTGPWSLIADLVYSDLSASQPTPLGIAFSQAVVTTKLTMLSGYALYRIQDDSDIKIDLGGGLRAFGLDFGLSLTPGALQGVSKDVSESWVNPLIAGRIIVPFDDNWFATAFADFGGTASDDQTWQALVSLGYQFNDNWSMQFGYRWLDLQHPVGDNDTEIELGGPFIGASYRF